MPRKRSNDNIIYDLHNFNILPETREIFLNSADSHDDEPGIDYRSATILSKNLRFLQFLDIERSILIHMHTIGGEWNDGIAIFDIISAAPQHITILAHAHARSMSSIILQAADTRILMPNCDFMIHYGSFSIDSSTTSAISEMRWCEHLNKIMLNIYADRCIDSKFFNGKSINYIKNYLNRQMLLKQEWYMNPEEAIDLGFADGILGDKNYTTIDSLKST